jgi:hypothetical protein
VTERSGTRRSAGGGRIAGLDESWGFAVLLVLAAHLIGSRIPASSRPISRRTRVQWSAMAGFFAPAGARGGAPRLRTRAAGVLAAALLLTLLPLHSGLEQHEPLDGSTEVFLTARQVDGASYLEKARPVELRPCLACMLQLQTLGSAVATPAVLPALVSLGVAAEPPRVAFGRLAPRLVASRGPPVA